MADHYAWKNPCETLHSWFKLKINEKYPNLLTHSWDHVINFLVANKQD
jgi:hypothetical protein